MNKGKDTPPGAVTVLHAQWVALRSRLNSWPSRGERELKLAVDEMAKLEMRIARTASTAPAEIAAKLRLVQTGKVQSVNEGALIESAIRDLLALDGGSGA